ncbi:hypothetical protein OKHIL_28000 [Mycolicibacterium mageritense]
MTTNTDWDFPYTREDAARALTELMNDAGDGGIHEDDLMSAMQAFKDLFTTTALLDLWMDRRARIGWRDGELTFTAVVDDGKDN